MNTICEEFDQRIQHEKITGTYQWIQEKLSHPYEERKVFYEYLSNISTDDFTPKQHLILGISLKHQVSITNVQELEVALDTLDEEDIAELIAYYNLENPAQRYQEIKTAIAAPTSYLTTIPYKVIQELHQRGKVPFDRQIFAACLVRFNVWSRTSYKNELSEKAKQKFDNFFPKDDFTLDILMAIFEMELGIEGAFYVEDEFTISAVVIELVRQNYISRSTIQQKLFDAFNNPTLKQNTHGWAKNVYRDLAFTVDENIACQEQLIQLMYNSRNLLVNFALQQLKKMANHQAFNWKLFVDSLEGIVYAEKLNGGLKTALKTLQKGFKKDKALLESGCINLAPIFLQEDNAVQLAAKECFELLETPNEEVKSALLPFVDTMHSEVKSALGDLLGEEATNTTTYETYQQQTYTPIPCTEEGKIVYVSSEDEFIFLASKVLKSNDALDYELFLEAITRYSYLKDTNPKALKPALKQAKKLADDGYLDITARVGVHHTMAAKLICMWLSDTPGTIATEIVRWEDKVKKEDRYKYTANRWFRFFYQFKRVGYIIHQFSQKEMLPLLSTPTHHNFEIAPTLFFKRLQQYQVAKQTPDEVDFCMALCRLNRWASFDKGNLNTTTEHNTIIHYLFTPEATFDPKQIKNFPTLWLTAYMLKNPEKAVTSLFKIYNNEDWWVASPTWNWEVNKRHSDRGHSWTNLDIGFDQEKISDIDSSKNSYFEHHLSNSEFIIADVAHWFSRDGFLQEPLYLNIILRAYSWGFYDPEASESKSILEVVKYNAQHPTPLARAGYLFLTLSLLCSNKAIRAATFDWLSLLIENNYLDMDEFTTAVAKIVASKEHPIPIPRLIEQFDRLASIQGVYADVLYKTIETCLIEINVDHLPKSFSKVLHHYYEVLQIIQQSIPLNIVKKLEQMQQINAVKKEVKKLGKFVS
ncbi:hypothetical protein BKI52_04810 [marine bacterium AO1-C]|nr:hypothetical protein BKI52_04810 [marine bacterium AO1-C]